MLAGRPVTLLHIPAGAALTFGFLSAAIASLWLPWRPGRVPGGALWLALLVAAAGSGNHYGFVSWRGVLTLVALGLAVHAGERSGGSNLQRGLAIALAVGLALALMAHVLPGFANPRVVDAVSLSPQAIPYSKYLNFDKAAAGLLLIGLAGFRPPSALHWRRVLLTVARLAPATALLLLALSRWLGYVAWEPGWPPILLFWAWTNLFFTCVAEEALFRGLIQRRLAAGLARYRHGPAAGLLIAAALFGLAHAAGGWSYVLLSTVAGVGYGLAYRWSGRIEASIATHFAVNLVHFTLFTYPALAVS